MYPRPYAHYTCKHMCLHVLYALYVPVTVLDPVRAEKYQDELLRAREKMQKAQDEKAAVYKEKTDEVCVCACVCVCVCVCVHVHVIHVCVQLAPPPPLQFVSV